MADGIEVEQMAESRPKKVNIEAKRRCGVK